MCKDFKYSLPNDLPHNISVAAATLYELVPACVLDTNVPSGIQVRAGSRDFWAQCAHSRFNAQGALPSEDGPYTSVQRSSGLKL